MKQREPSVRIIWAIEPYADDADLLRKMAAVLKLWTEGSTATIEPVAILEPEPVALPPGMFLEIDVNRRIEVKRRLDAALKDLDLPGLLPVTLLTAEQISLRSAVHLLVDHAERARAEFIAVCTHSKKIVSRFFFGSFAETLVLQDRVPVFAINPKADSPYHLKHFLYPTDLSGKSRRGLDSVIALAKEWNAKITLMHKVEYISDYTEVSKQRIIGFSDLIAKDIARRREEAEAMLKQVRDRGVEADLAFCDEPGEVEESILKRVSTEQAGVVAIVSQTGPIASTILGSVTRRILREAPCPVWVIHPPKAAAADTHLEMRS